ncbi:hypothetical protein SERLA73DRAFT_167599 [Serpula lacrymans var. lacrymans S7.3]|uniref:Uncharacterized protein n=2 Tax=Serpula lacrymans var. lacrymans TaxID=341189 RepID=F8PUH4_SERL3|nr:uncharacterized protein SERLADRAFT_448251 [Serpula lacrymans var. lacrymans S7.9]EGN99694.1 hypothetical protein SERLA73DRAFT_167599 [Serpula lacrymans var. lacrymans S7.3]EGO25255.1 hypothetical protein SERLADRAFT_448251 [Serpula lacrymans var. lacrymans S7.9]
MSGSVYRLETPRPRPPPPTLRFHSPSKSPSALSHPIRDTQTLLYDLPASSVISPPTSPPTKRGVVSPTSPSFPGGRARGRRNGRPGPTPPPSARHRSVTPLGVSRSDLEKFTEHCRAWYYNQDDASGRHMTQTLANLPPAQCAPYSRLQASIRSAYHASVNARRHAEFQAHLTATLPGGSLMPHSRADPRGLVARKERLERLDRFVRSWCTMGMPGTTPFFEALWAIMRLQVVPEHLGGAGGNRIRWELDDAVFKEAAGKNFMLEAIDVLKGVLAFEEVPSSKGGSSSIGAYPTSPAIHSRSRSQPLPANDNEPGQKASPISMATHGKRARAPSDPFLDTPPALSHSLPSASSQSSGVTISQLSSSSVSEGVEHCMSPTTPHEADEDIEVLAPLRSEFAMEESEEEYLRIWTSADLPNPEYLSLITVFPSFITRRPLPRFPVTPSARAADIEEGEDERGEGKEIRFGTGSMWISSKQRGDDWRGDWWTRFILWWRRLFC